MTQVMALGDWRDNGEMIADVAKLGYLNGSVLDATYGKGMFWKHWAPEALTWSPRDDFTKLSYLDNSFDSVVFDPPYKTTGTPSSAEMDERYGTTKYQPVLDLIDRVVAGLAECARVSRKYVLLKCQDQVVGGEVLWQTYIFVDEATNHLDLDLRDSFLFRSHRPQPPGRRQLHARRNYSTLLVFEKRPTWS